MIIIENEQNFFAYYQQKKWLANVTNLNMF